jgi:ornithine cyclodeaminase/alanine dehydrogenase-like protein (mu-crystallin family)
MDVLNLTYEEVESLLTPEMCLESLEEAYREKAEKRTVDRPRSHSYIPLEEPHKWYYLKTMEGGVKKTDIVALRINSGHMLHLPERHDYVASIETPEGKKWFEIIMLFSITTGNLLAVMPGGYIQKMRVGSTSALGSKYMARKSASTIGLYGSSWQAEAQLVAHSRVREIKKVQVYSLTRENRKRFARKMEDQLGIVVEAVDRPEEAMRGADIVISATSSYVPVIHGKWLEEGMHFTFISGLSELDDEAIGRAQRIVVHQRIGAANVSAGEWDHRFEEKGLKNLESYPELADLILGRAVGRETEREITCFVTNQGLGIQFAALGSRILHAAREKKVGRYENWDHLLQSVHP